MRVYVLNLARAEARRRTIQASANAVGLVLTFIEAVDGRHLGGEERALVDHEARQKFTRFPLSNGEIGCWLSHRRAMQALLDSGDRMAAILEDDVCLLDEFGAALDAIETYPGAFDLITLHRNFDRREIFVSCAPLWPGGSIGRVGYSQTGNVGYVISRDGAAAFLAARPRPIHAIDKELHRYWATGLDIYALSRPVVRHYDGGHSYLEETRLHDQPQRRVCYPGADRLYWRLHRCKSRVSESIRKRLAFPAYASSGRAHLAGSA